MLTIDAKVNEWGIIKVADTGALAKWQIDNAGKEVVVTIKIKRQKRSNPQNAYYWGVVIPAVTNGINYLGNSFEEDETHEFLKARFNSKEIEIIPDHFIDVPQSTTKMDTFAFMEYIAKIQQFAAQMLNIYIPDPNEPMTID